MYYASSYTIASIALYFTVVYSCLQNEKVVYQEGVFYEEQKETVKNTREILNYGGH
jgi:hypothetical protein